MSCIHTSHCHFGSSSLAFLLFVCLSSFAIVEPQSTLIMAAKNKMHGSDSDDSAGRKSVVNSYNDKVKKMFMTKNPDKKVEVLMGLLSTSADLCQAFFMQFEESHIKLVAEKLSSLEIWDVKMFANEKGLFAETDPMWRPGGDSAEKETESAAKFLQAFLQTARTKVAEADLEQMTSGGGRRRSRQSFRGRSRERKKLKGDKDKKKKGRSSSPSSSSSDKRRETAIDFTSTVGSTEFKEISIEHFPDAKMAVKVMKKCKAGAVLSSEAIEKWIPQCVGSDLPSVAQKKLVAEREKSTSLTLAQLLEQSSAFWLTHGVANRVTPISVLRHILLLIKLASQSYTNYAVQYERALIQHIRTLKTDVDINTLISEKVHTVETEVNIYFSRVANAKEVPPIQKPSTWMGSSKGGKGKGAKGMARAEPGRFRGEEKRICFYHDPNKNQKCIFGDKCKDEHLNTKKEDQRKRFEKARAARR